MASAIRNPSTLSWTVTSVLLRYIPDAMPSDKLANTSPGFGKNKLETRPVVVVMYQLTNSIRASTSGGTTVSTCPMTFSMGVRLRVARLVTADDTLLACADTYSRPSKEASFLIEVVTLIDFPQS